MDLVNVNFVQLGHHDIRRVALDDAFKNFAFYNDFAKPS